MAYSADHRAKSQILYTQQGLSIPELSDLFDIPEKTLHRWKRAEEWDSKKAAFVISPIALAQKFRDRIARIMQIAEEEKRDLTDAEVDRMSKLQAMAYKISPNSTIVSIGMDVIKDFGLYLKSKDEALARAILPHSQDFIRLLFKPRQGV